MSLHHSFYNIYSQYLFNNFQCYNVCVFDQDPIKHFTSLSTFADMKEGLNVLDVGCGNGQFLNFLYNNYKDMECLGIDASQQQISIASKNTQGALYAQAHLESFTSSPKYDRIFFNESLGYAGSQQYPLLHKYRDMLKPDGLLIISTLTKHQNKRGFNFEEIAKNYKDFFKKQGCGLYSLIVLSGDFEYHLLDLNFIKNNFEHSICSSKTYIQKKWLTRRPSTEYTLFLEEELLDSHVIFKIYGPKEKN